MPHMRVPAPVARLVGRIPPRFLPERLRNYVRRVHMLEESLLFRDGFRKPEETTPPVDERFTTHAVWAVELYTPLHAQELLERLRALGFDTDTSRDRTASASIRRSRAAPRGGSWVNLDMVLPRAQNPHPFFGIRGDLPTGVRAAHPHVWTITPSLTVLVVQFVLDDEASGRLDAVCRRVDFDPVGSLTSSGVQITPPDNVKEAAIRQTRRELRGLASSWIAEHLPGAFAARGEGHQMPTAELVTVELTVPFVEQQSRMNYLDFAGFGYDPFAWVSDELKVWRLVFDRDGDCMVVAARRSDVIDSGQLAHRGDDETWAIAGHTNDYLGKDLVLWAASSHLVASQARLAEIRDQGVGLAAAHMPARRLTRIGHEFLRDSLDARTSAAELRQYASNQRAFEWNAAEWKGEGRFAEERLLARLSETIRANAKALLASEQRLRDSLLVESTILTALANLRVQRWVVALSALAAAVAIVSLWISAR